MKIFELTKYSDRFFKDFENESYRSAIEVLPIIFSLFEVSSVIDYGCGTGAWLRAARELGASKVTGIDGSWVHADMLVDPNIELITSDLQAAVPPPSVYDLAICVEVAEHLPEECGDKLVKDLCNASERVLFSAAIPGQGGTSHINEQWQSYWALKFAANGYCPLDIIRPQLYEKRGVLSWYRNNTLLYVKRDNYRRLLGKILDEGRLQLAILDIVIPEVFNNPGLRHSIRIARRIPEKILSAILWRLRIRRWRL